MDRRHRLSAAAQHLPRLVVGQVGGRQHVGRLGQVRPSGRVRTEQPAAQRVGVRFVDGFPAEHEVSEGLGQEFDVAGPVVRARPLVPEAAPGAEPGGEGEVVGRDPHLQPGVAPRLQHGAVALDLGGVVAALIGLQPRPIQRKAEVLEAQALQEGEILRMAGREAVAGAGRRGVPAPFPGPPVAGGRRALTLVGRIARTPPEPFRERRNGHCSSTMSGPCIPAS